MTRSSLAVALVLAAAAVAAGPAFAANAALFEPARPAAPAPDPASVVTTGASVAGFGGGPVVVDLRQVPTGDPEAVHGVLRGHEQGQYEGTGQPDYMLGDPMRDAGVVFGESPVTPSGTRSGDGTEAPGDWLHIFDGQTATGWIPPDPVLAAGPRYLVEVVNSGFTVFSKDGGLDRAYTDLETFFNPILSGIPCSPADCFVFDPRVVYSQYWGQFVIEALARDDTNQRSYIVFAVSQSDNPLGGWWLYWTGNPDSGTTSWTDYTGMSADPWGVYFTGNDWNWAGGFRYAMELSIRPDVFSGTWNGGWAFWGLTWNEPGNPQAFDIQPVVDPLLFPGDSATWFVNTFNSSGTLANIWKLTGDRGNGPTLVRNSATVSAYADPGLAHQPVGADDIEMFYAGSQNVSYSQRHVYLALNDAGAGNSGFYVSKINVDSFAEARNITYYSGTDYYYYPNAILFGSDTTNPLVAVAMSWSSDAQYASGVVKTFVDYTVDASGPFWNMAGGSGSYNVYFNGRNRWGDYMGIARDPLCDTAWQVTQYAPAVNVWRTRISEVAGNTTLPARLPADLRRRLRARQRPQLVRGRAVRECTTPPPARCSGFRPRSSARRGGGRRGPRPRPRAPSCRPR